MDKLKVAHEYRDGPARKHDWHCGWVAEAAGLLLAAPEGRNDPEPVRVVRATPRRWSRRGGRGSSSVGGRSPTPPTPSTPRSRSPGARGTRQRPPARGDGHGRRPTLRPAPPLGRTGFVATALGIGDLADRCVPIETCVATARRALDAGLNVIDTAPNYEDGYSEEIVGRAVRGSAGCGLRDRQDRPARSARSARRSTARSAGSGSITPTRSCSTACRPWPCSSACASPAAGSTNSPTRSRAGKCRFRGISSHHPDVLRAALTAGRVRHRHVPGRAVRGRAVRDRHPAAGQGPRRRDGLLQDVRGGQAARATRPGTTSRSRTGRGARCPAAGPTTRQRPCRG